jgi:hypothetical protein
MTDFELELEARIRKGEIALQQNHGADEAVTIQLHMDRLHYEIESERRRGSDEQIGNESDAIVQLKIEQLEYEQTLREVKMVKNGSGAVNSDVDVKMTLRLDKLRLKLERRKRLNAGA